MRRFRQLYGSASSMMKWQFWMTVTMIVLVVTIAVSAQGISVGQAGEARTLTVQNLISLAFLVYGVGMTVQQFRDLARRMVTMEKFRDEEVPETYLRKDVFEARFGRRTSDHHSSDQI
jgi:hypothetical protein